MPAVGDTITGLVTYAPSKLVRAVGLVRNVFATRFFAQLRSPLNGQMYNAYFDTAAQGTTWVPGDQSGDATIGGLYKPIFEDLLAEGTTVSTDLQGMIDVAFGPLAIFSPSLEAMKTAVDAFNTQLTAFLASI